MGQQKGSLGGRLKAKGVTSGSGSGGTFGRLAAGPMGMLFGGGLASATAKAISAPGTSPSTSETSSPFSKQESFGINSITSPFGGIRRPALKKRDAWDADLELPDTTVGLTPGSEDKEEEDTITAPRINDEEKRREATDKASTWLN